MESFAPDLEIPAEALRLCVEALDPFPVSADEFWERRLTRRGLRELAGLTQAELATQIGTDPSTIARWEAGTRRGSGVRAETYRTILDGLAQVAMIRLEALALYTDYQNAGPEERPQLAEALTEAWMNAYKTDIPLWPIQLDRVTGSLPAPGEGEARGPD